MALANTFFTTQEVAKKLGISRGRVSQLCMAIRAKKQKIGTLVGASLVFTDVEIERLRATNRPRGRPVGSRDRVPRNSKMMA